jgi:hypothetical protein
MQNQIAAGDVTDRLSRSGLVQGQHAAPRPLDKNQNRAVGGQSARNSGEGFGCGSKRRVAQQSALPWRRLRRRAGRANERKHGCENQGGREADHG